jgi:ubiquinone/menaquinone biosynthesis C-methylase UbiE
MFDPDDYYQTRFEFDARRSLVWKCLCEWLQPRVPSQGAVLEIGAGYCDFINNIRARKKIAVDIAQTVKKAAAPDVETHVGSCENLDFIADANLDVVFASNLLEHLSVAAGLKTIREAYRVLKKGGQLIIIQPNFRYGFREYFDDYTHVSIYTDVSLADLIRGAGFQITQVEPRFMPLSLKGKLPVSRWLIRLYLRSPIRPKAGQMLIIARK